MSRAGDGGDGGGGQLLMSHFTELAGAQLAVQSQWVQLTLALAPSLPRHVQQLQPLALEDV